METARKYAHVTTEMINYRCAKPDNRKKLRKRKAWLANPLFIQK
jgi:hypothetical protein